MCGICGLICAEPGMVANRQRLEGMVRSMTRRGPDGAGTWYSACGQAAFGHTRLAIIDPKARSSQPMEYLNGRYVITYNGEVYNYKSLRRELDKRGYSFSTRSDTEVIMALYDCYGPRMLDRLRGMFSFAIRDTETGTLFAARDPFGIKPFYYYKGGNEFVFASQVRTVSDATPDHRSACAAGWCGFLKFGSIPEPFTTLEHIRALPAGHWLELDSAGSMRIHRYFNIYKAYANIEGAGNRRPDYDRIGQAIQESVSHHLVADVPVGIFLSAGLDSNVIAWYAKQQNDRVKAFTLDFEEFGGAENEAGQAGVACEQYGLEHHRTVLGRGDMESCLEEFFESMDQPSIDGLNVWMISKTVQKAGYKAVLSGLGGDEVLAGYPSFTDVPRYLALLRLLESVPGLKRTTRMFLHNRLSQQRVHPRARGFTLCTKPDLLSAYRLKRSLFLDDELAGFFDPDFVQQGLARLESLEQEVIKGLSRLSSPYLMVSALETDQYMKNQLLRDADWACMYHSIELRLPFVDRELVLACAGELVAARKPDKASTIREILTGRLPDLVLSRRKSGFQTPAENWLNTIPGLQHWKNNEILTGRQCPWARRWAYEVKSRCLH